MNEFTILERYAGIEPATQAWKALMLPLHQYRIFKHLHIYFKVLFYLLYIHYIINFLKNQFSATVLISTLEDASQLLFIC